MDAETLLKMMRDRVTRGRERLTESLSKVAASDHPISDMVWLSGDLSRAAEVEVGLIVLGMLSRDATVPAVGARALDEAFSASRYPPTGSLLECLSHGAKAREWAHVAELCGSKPELTK